MYAVVFYFEDVVRSYTTAIIILRQMVAPWDYMWPHLVINAALGN